MYSGMSISLWPGIGCLVAAVEADLIAALVLGPVQREVGGGQQLEQVAAVLAVDRDADRDRHADPRVASEDAQRAGAAAETLRDRERLGGIRPGQQDGELLTAEPADDVGVADLLPQLGRQAPEHLVAGQVAVGVVHPLE